MTQYAPHVTSAPGLLTAVEVEEGPTAVVVGADDSDCERKLRTHAVPNVGSRRRILCNVEKVESCTKFEKFLRHRISIDKINQQYMKRIYSKIK